MIIFINFAGFNVERNIKSYGYVQDTYLRGTPHF